jgi:hypothetical protein
VRLGLAVAADGGQAFRGDGFTALAGEVMRFQCRSQHRKRDPRTLPLGDDVGPNLALRLAEVLRRRRRVSRLRDDEPRRPTKDGQGSGTFSTALFHAGSILPTKHFKSEFPMFSKERLGDE